MAQQVLQRARGRWLIGSLHSPSSPIEVPCPSPAATPPPAQRPSWRPTRRSRVAGGHARFFVAYRVGMIIFVAASTACAAARDPCLC